VYFLLANFVPESSYWKTVLTYVSFVHFWRDSLEGKSRSSFDAISCVDCHLLALSDGQVLERGSGNKRRILVARWAV